MNWQLTLALILILLVIFMMSTKHRGTITIQQMPAASILRYQKTSGSSGKIYSIDIITNGNYEITCLHGKTRTVLHSGRLSGKPLNAAARLIQRPPKPCIIEPTAADSMVSTISYPLIRKVVYMGTLDSSKLAGGYEDVLTLDEMLHVVA